MIYTPSLGCLRHETLSASNKLYFHAVSAAWLLPSRHSVQLPHTARQDRICSLAGRRSHRPHAELNCTLESSGSHRTINEPSRRILGCFLNQKTSPFSIVLLLFSFIYCYLTKVMSISPNLTVPIALSGTFRLRFIVCSFTARNAFFRLECAEIHCNKLRIFCSVLSARCCRRCVLSFSFLSGAPTTWLVRLEPVWS